MGARAVKDGFRVRRGSNGTTAENLEGDVRGIAGLLLAPLTGVMSLTSKTTEGFASDLRSMTPGGMERKARMGMMRERQPRQLGAGAVLLPFPRVDEEGEGSMRPHEDTHGVHEPEVPALEQSADATDVPLRIAHLDSSEDRLE